MTRRYMSQQVARSLGRYKMGFGDVGIALDAVFVNVFYRDSTFDRKVLEWAVIQKDYSANIEPATEMSGAKLIEFAKELYYDSNDRMEKYDYDPFDAREGYKINPLKYPVKSFEDWVYTIFQEITYITCNTSSIFGLTIFGVTHWGTKGGLKMIGESGGNDTGTDYNAVFFDDPKLFPSSLPERL